jgi:hypothetical protein
LGNRLDSTDFVIRVHDADQKCARGDCPADVVRIDETGSVNRHVTHRSTQTFQEFARLNYRRVFNLGGHDMRGTIVTTEKEALE